jgi:Alpha/beta hydrolase family
MRFRAGGGSAWMVGASTGCSGTRPNWRKRREVSMASRWAVLRGVTHLGGKGGGPVGDHGKAPAATGGDFRLGLWRFGTRDERTDIIIGAIAERSDVILVAQSLAGFTVPPVCARAPMRMVVLVNAMIPRPGETAGAWWGATGAVDAREQAAARFGYATEFDVGTYFLHDLPQDVLRAGPEQPREQAETVFGEPCRFERWPDIPIHVLAGRDDRFFPIEFQRRVARERLGKEVDEIPGGHLVALSNAEGLAQRLLAYEKGLRR